MPRLLSRPGPGAWLVGLAIVAGAALRLWNLGPQILGGDELHAVRAAVRFAPGEILRHYSLTDYSLPLTALYSSLLRAGVGLDEWAWRLPSLVAGVLALALLPGLLARRLGTGAMAAYAALLAASPGLVLYSRIARSYMPMVLLAAIAIPAFGEWWEKGGWRFAALYVATGTGAVWLHLGAAPIVASPFLWAAWRTAVRARRARGAGAAGPGAGAGLWRLASLAAASAAAWSLCLLPALPSLLEVIRTKGGQVRPPLDCIWAAARLLAGSASSPVAALFWLGAAAGLVGLLRRQPAWAGLTLTAVAAHALALGLLAPYGAADPIVLARYLLPILPFALLWLAALLPAPLPRLVGAAAALVLAAWVAAGPLVAAGFRRGSFAHHNLFLGFFEPPPAPAAPPFYRRLPPGPVLEAPWHASWNAGWVFPVQQLEHRRRVLVAAEPQHLPRHPGLRLRNAVSLEPAAILASPAASLVLHTRLPREETALAPLRWPTRLTPRMRDDLMAQARRARAELVAAFGAPDRRSRSVLVWHLDRVRARRAAGD